MTDEKDILLHLILDYITMLSPQAVQTYLCYRLLKDENNITDVTYAYLTEHFGMATSTIANVNEQLRAAGLIEIIEKDDFGRFDEHYQSTRKQLIRVLSVKSFTPEARKECFKKTGLTVDSVIRERILTLNNLPLEYQSLLSKKDLCVALDKLGREKFTVANLILFFKLDKEKVKLWLSSKLFKMQLIKLMKEVVKSSEQRKVEEELAAIVVKKNKKNKKNIKTYDNLYDELMKVNIAEDGTEIPISQWKPIHLLRYFCVLYQQQNNRKYTIMFGSYNSFSCKEIKELSQILHVFGNNAVEMVRYLDWIFREKDGKLRDGILNTSIVRAAGMINEYKKKSSKPVQYSDTDPIDQSFIVWIKENVPEIFKQYDLQCMKDLYWLKESYDQDEHTEEVNKVVEEGIRRQIIPKKGNLAFKRG